MKYGSTLSVEEFRSALKKTFDASAPRGHIPELSQATVFCSKDSCTIACTNLTQWCQTTIPAQGDAFSLTFYDTRKLLDACSYFSGELRLEFYSNDSQSTSGRTSDNEVSIISNGRELHQLSLASDLIPPPKEFHPDHVYTINAGTFSNMFRQIQHAVSDDQNRPGTCCAQFIGNKMFALDGYRLSVRTIPGFYAEKPFLIPRKAMELLSVFGEADCTLSVGTEYMSVKNGSTRLTSRIPAEEPFPLESAIPTTFSTECVVEVSSVQKAMRYLIKMSGSRFGREKKPVRLSDGHFSICGNTGLYRPTAALDPIPDIEIGYNPRYLLEAFESLSLKMSGTVKMGFTTPVGPTLLTDEAGRMEMILPVRLKDETPKFYHIQQSGAA